MFSCECGAENGPIGDSRVKIKRSTSPRIQSEERKRARGAARFSSVNFSQETPLISPPLTDRDFLQRASLDGYQKQPLTHARGSEHLGSPQHQMRRLAEMKPDCRQQSSVLVESPETNPRRPDALSQTDSRTLATARSTQTDNVSDVKCLPLSLLASRHLPEQICTGCVL